MQQPDSALPCSTAEMQRLQKLACEEARINRDELERLYDAGMELIGDVRYHYLWRLAQLEQTTTALGRRAAEAAMGRSLNRLRTTIADLALRAVELRQEARLLLNAYQRAAEARAQARPTGAESEAVAIPATIGA